ncbi:Alpha/Beta hydrolase protein [Mycena crocata]|nr:Alpha/Beta hydrolase protein [Mycena crocata]
MSSLNGFQEAWLPGPYGTNFYTRRFIPSTPIAVLVFLHGAAEHCGRYTPMHTLLSGEHNIAVFAFDQRGYGQTALHPKHRSGTSEYGKTDWSSQMDDAEWALKHARAELPDLPLFLMGASMGGGIVLSLLCDVERAKNPVVSGLAGVISSAPCLRLATPPPRIVLWIGAAIARVKPYMLYPVRNKPEQLSRNPDTNATYVADPFVMSPGSFRSLLDMLNEGEKTLTEHYSNWPKETPLLLLHGDADPINSVKGTADFFDKVPAKDKKLTTYPGAYHELHNEPDGVKDKYLLDVVEFVRAHLNTV